MSKATDLLTALYDKGVRLWLDNGQIRYRATHGALNSEQVDALRDLKQEVIAALFDKNETAVDGKKDVAQIITLAPLTFRQESLWNAVQQDPPGSNRMVPHALRLHGPLSVDALRRGLSAVVHRHEALRTTIALVDGTVKQRVHQPPESSLHFIRLTHMPKVEAEAEAQSAVLNIFTRPVDLAVGPLFRAALISVLNNEHVLAVSVHHIVTDAASFSLFFKELWLFYNDFVLSKSTHYPPVEMQCADYARWQHSTHFQWHEEYWRGRLANATRLKFPVDPPSSVGKQRHAAGGAFSLGMKLSNLLHEFSRRERMALGIVVLALYAAFVSHSCNQRDLILPFQARGRPYPEHLNMMGYFAHPLLLRIEMTGQETFHQVLQLVSCELFNAEEHTDCGKLIAIAPHFMEGGLFQWYTYAHWDFGETVPIRGSDGSSVITVEEFVLQEDTTPGTEWMETDIMFHLHDAKSEILGFVMYRLDLFTSERIQKLMQEFKALAEYAITHPADRLSEFTAWAGAHDTFELRPN